MAEKIPNLALSVRQPYAEQIMRGTKRIEYRSIRTNIRGRVYVYASKAPAMHAFHKMKKKPGDFPVGVLVGSVEIVDCVETKNGFEWTLRKPHRLKRTIKPDRRPQPVWFKPFNSK